MTTTYLNPAASNAGPAPQVAVRARQTALAGLFLLVAAVEFSIAAAQILLALTLVAWATALVLERRWPGAPAWGLPLALFAGWTLVSACVSAEPVASLIDSKQLLLFLLVPLAYDLIDDST